MEILLVAATSFEIKPFLDFYKLKEGENRLNKHNIKVLITGVGMVATSFSMGRLHSQTFDLAINAGIAGAFDRSLQLGEVVRVAEDIFAELGAEDDLEFITIEHLGFGESYYKPLISPDVTEICSPFKPVRAITVNKVHGNAGSIERTYELFSPAIESMEGAAFFYSCKHLSIPCLQLRSISNYVERRNRESWNLEIAIRHLNNSLIELIKNL